jgi:septal ring factor EnvC (AmiA/AmiB activator)
MASDTTLFDAQAIHGTFQQWRADQAPLANELSESLSALAAYQSHLDAWQQALVRERDELASSRQQLAMQRAEAEKTHAQSAAQSMADLTEAREKIASLTSALLARTDELRALDGRRAEVVTELELSRARERELNAKLEELKQLREEERAQSTDEVRHLRELVERRLETTDSERRPAPAVAPGNSPVLGSIVEQFGKLRQQRALDRPGPNRTR